MSAASPVNDAHVDSEESKVHSANAWEKVDLGDEDRNNKFLRLMGAGKKEHHGRIVIGDQIPDHIRNSRETEKIQHELLDQYEQSMQHRLAGGRRGHLGLGYQEPEKESPPHEDSGEADGGDNAGSPPATAKVQDISDSSTDSKEMAGKMAKTEDAPSAGDGESEGVETEGHDVQRNKRKSDSRDGVSPEKKLHFVKADS